MAVWFHEQNLVLPHCSLFPNLWEAPFLWAGEADWCLEAIKRILSGLDPSTQPGFETTPSSPSSEVPTVPPGVLFPSPALCSFWELQPPPGLIHGVLGALEDLSQHVLRQSEREAAFWLFL